VQLLARGERINLIVDSEMPRHAVPVMEIADVKANTRQQWQIQAGFRNIGNGNRLSDIALLCRMFW
jgi:hypothetical protein